MGPLADNGEYDRPVSPIEFSFTTRKTDFQEAQYRQQGNKRTSRRVAP
jgi:hypothetical protein